MQTETAEQFAQQLKNDSHSTRVLDVRTWPEYHERHVRGAKLIPLDDVDADEIRSAFPGDETIHVLCKTGPRSHEAVEKLEHQGMDNLVLVDGGTDGAITAGAPTEGSAGMGLNRQVQLTAGVCTLLGTLLALNDPWFLIIPGFFGAGLTFAGLTGKCGMAMVLTKMPWNRRPEA